MKKRLISIFTICILAVSTMLSCILPCVKNTNVAKADSESSPVVYQTLITTNMTTSDWTNVYGGVSSELSNFTPFNKQEETRMTGKSIIPESNENNQLINKTYKLASNGGLSSEMSLSFGIWLYFSDVSVHALSIKLTIDNDNYITYSLTKDLLIDLLKKGDGINEQPFAWNYIELPFSSASVVGSIYEDNVLKEFKTITFNYQSSQILDNAEFSRLRFYGLCIQESTVNVITATEKQDYANYLFNFWDESITNNVIKGDTLKTLYLQNAVKYAWIGEVDLLHSSNLISWQIVITKPSGSNENYNFGESITFNEDGVYLLSYKAESKSDELNINLYDYIEFYVRKDNFIYFDFASYSIVSGDEIIVEMNIDNILDLSSLEILSVNISNNIAVVESLEDFKYRIKGFKKGTADLNIKIKAKRVGSDQLKEYEAKTSIVVKNGEKSNDGLITFLWISLGVIAIIGLGIGIRIIILSRRNDVK